MSRGFCDYTLEWLWIFDWAVRVTRQRTVRLVFSDWTGSFVVVLVRKYSGLHIEKGQSCLEMGERLGVVL